MEDGGQILDVITRHVMSEGMTEKIRMLRAELCSK